MKDLERELKDLERENEGLKAELASERKLHQTLPRLGQFYKDQVARI